MLSRVLVMLAIVAGAVLLRVISGVGFANYDTLYALVWGQQLSRGETPQYGIPLAPTPHPLVEAFGLVLSPLGPRATEDVVVALCFVALAACGWVVYRLGATWFGRAAGALAAIMLLTRVPILSYGVRAYIDIPYLLFVLAALLVETRRRHAGAPVLALLALAGLLRPEAWLFSALYWLYLVPWRTPPQLARLALIAAAAPALWLFTDLLVTGDPLWSLTNTRQTAHTLARVTGIANVPEYIPRRIGEILRPAVLAAAAVGGVLSLLWLRERARLAAAVGLLAVAVFALFATAGLPINTRYAFLPAAILCIFCGAGVFGWTRLPSGDSRRRWWIAASAVLGAWLLLTIPSQYRSADHELDNLARQQTIQNDLVALVDDGSIGLSCGPVGVPNHRPIPLLSLRLKTSPKNVVSAEVMRIARGTYVDPATAEVRSDYILDLHDPHPLVARVPPGFVLMHESRSWRVYARCR
jgi:hypothetical protein